MRKYFYPILAASTLLFAASCSQDDELVNGGNGSEQAVTFEVNLPGATQTRAIAEGVNVGEGNMATKLIWALYEDGKEQLLTTGVGNYRGNGTFSATIDMVKGLNYNVLFLAYNEENCAFDVAEDDDLKSLTLKSELQANQEAYDAFVACHNHTVNADAATTVTLTRPFAQVNVATTPEDLEKADKLKAMPTNTNLVIEDVPTVYNVLTGEATTEGNVTYAAAPILKDYTVTDGIANENITVSEKTYKYLTMAYVLAGATADADKSMHNATFEFYRDEEPELVQTLNISNLPIQRNYRTNVIGNILTQGENFEIVIDAEFKGDINEDAPASQVFCDAQTLATALTANEEDIYVVLGADIDLPITLLGQQTGGSGEYKLGGENTKSITIDLNGKKLNITTSYWSSIGAKNADALFTIKNGTMTSSQATGTWNSYDVTFANCNYVIEDVVFEKAIAFTNANKEVEIKNVTINETHDYYAMWVSAKGQTIDIDGLTINSSGRGIKIDEEYAKEDVAKVSLSVTGMSIESAKKGAIMVKSAAGADITLSNVDITKVAADPMNAVWVDEASKDYADLVTVVGGTKIVEDHPVKLNGVYYKSITATLEVAKSGDVIQVEGSAVIPNAMYLSDKTGTLTFEGIGKAATLSFNEVAGGADGGLNSYADGMDLVFKNLKVVSPNTGSSYSGGFGRVKSVLFDNCTYEGQYRSLGYLKFNNCVIDPKTSYIYTDYSDADFIGCRFNCSEGKGIQVYNDAASSNTTINVENCTFTAAKIGNTWDGKPVTAIDINSNGEKFAVNIKNTTATGFGTGLFSGSTLWNIKGGAEHVTVTIDNVLSYPFYEYDETTKTYTVVSAAGLKAIANMVNVEGNAFNGHTVKLGADINLNGYDWEPIGQTGKTTFNGVFDGQNHTISNLNVDSEAETGANYSSGLFGWVESHTAGHGHIKNVKISGATIKGHHNCGALVGYITQETALVENCHVTGATVTCTYANSGAEGDKAGALIGNATVATPVKDCTATNSTVSAGRDAGQVMGAGSEANVTGCSATNVTVTANGTGTGANVNNAVIGRVL